MSDTRRLHLAIIILTALCALSLAPLIWGADNLWALDSILHLPPGARWSLGILLALIPLAVFSAHALKFPASRLSTPAIAESLSRLRLLFVAALCVGLCLVLRSKAHFLGDGYSWIANYAARDSFYIHSIKATELLSSYFIHIPQVILGDYSKATVELIFAVFSVVSGGIVVWQLVRIAEIFYSDCERRVTFVLAATLTPAAALFFGYVEFYPLLWAGLAVFIRVSLVALRRGCESWWPAGALALVSLMHLSAAFFGLGAVFAVLQGAQGGAKKFLRSRFTWSVAALLLLVSAAGFIFKYQTDLGFRKIFLPALEGFPADPGYAIFSARHVIDVANVILLVSPALLGWLTIGLTRQALRDRDHRFLALCAFGGLLFLVVINPELGMARDWDLMSFSIFPAHLLAVKIALDRFQSGFRPVVWALTLVAGLLGAGFIWVNGSESTAERRFVQLLERRPQTSLSGWYIWRDFHRARGEYEIGDIALARVQQVAPQKGITDEGFRLVRNMELKKARPLVDSALALDSMHYSVNLLAAFYWHKRRDLALASHYYERVRQLEPDATYYYVFAFDYHMDMGDTARAFALGERGLQLYPANRDLNRSLGMAYLGFQRYEESRVCAERLRELDNTDPIPYYILTHLEAIRGNFGAANTHYRRFKQFNEDRALDSVMTARFGERLDR